MKFKFNPLTGEFNLVPDSGTLKQKLNWLTGEFNLTKDAGKYKQIYNVIEGEFNLRPAVTQVIVHGVGSIQLTNAVENGLLSLKAYGGTEQNGTPTPTTPVDIVCNNGVLKVRHQSGLPIGYTLLDYIKSGGNNYIDTGIKLTNEDVAEMQYLQTADKGAIYGEYYNGTSNMSTTLYGNGTFYFYPYNAQGNAISVGNYDANIHTVVHNFVDGYIDFDGVRTNFDLPSPNSFTNTLNCPIFGRSNGSSIGYFSKTKLYYFRIRRNGALILDLIPAKDSNDNVGMYDRVSGTLFTESGTGSFVAGNTIPDPMTVYAEGITETIGLNMLDLSNVDDGHYYSGTGEYMSYDVARLSNLVSVRAGDTISVTTQVLSGNTLNIRYNFFDTSKQWLSQSVYTLSLSDGEHTENLTAQQDGYFAFSGNYTGSGTILDWDNVIIMNNEKNVTAEMLLKIGDYTDEQEILSGSITRKVGVLVFDGTEDWEELGNSGANNHRFTLSLTAPSTDDVAASCTHIIRIIQSSTTSQTDRPCIRFSTTGEGLVWYELDKTTTLAQFRQWLADQYAAGTPVIVVYSLATPTTEHVAGQAMHIPAGGSTIEITQASIDNLELEAVYEQEV